MKYKNFGINLFIFFAIVSYILHVYVLNPIIPFFIFALKSTVFKEVQKVKKKNHVCESRIYVGRHVCLCIYMYTRIYTNVNAYIHTYIYTQHIYLYLYFQCSSFFTLNLSNFLISLPFSLQDFFSLASLVAQINQQLAKFLFIWKWLYFTLSKNHFSGKRILDQLVYFSFQHVGYASPISVVSIASNKKLAVSYIIVPLYVMSHFYLLPSRFSLYLWLSKIWFSHTQIYFLWFILLWICWISCICKLMFFTKFEYISAIFFSNIFLIFSLSWDFNYMYFAMLYMAVLFIIILSFLLCVLIG